MKDLLEYVKLARNSKPEDWGKIYVVIRDAYGKAITRNISLKETQEYKKAKDVIYLSILIEEDKQISNDIVESSWLKDIISQYNENVPKTMIYSLLSEYKYYFDVFFILDIITKEKLREDDFRKIPLYSALGSALLVALTTLTVNVFFPNKLGFRIDDLTQKAAKTDSVLRWNNKLFLQNQSDLKNFVKDSLYHK
jgi:hypothetical protein